jgi:hypothetical protein
MDDGELVAAAVLRGREEQGASAWSRGGARWWDILCHGRSFDGSKKWSLCHGEEGRAAAIHGRRALGREWSREHRAPGGEKSSSTMGACSSAPCCRAPWIHGEMRGCCPARWLLCVGGRKGAPGRGDGSRELGCHG